MEAEYPPSAYPTASAQEKALAKEAGCSWSTVQRILAPKKGGADRVGTKLDTIADLAGVFGVRPMDLLAPNFASFHLRTRRTPTLVGHEDYAPEAPHRKSGGQEKP